MIGLRWAVCYCAFVAVAGTTLFALGLLEGSMRPWHGWVAGLVGLPAGIIGAMQSSFAVNFRTPFTEQRWLDWAGGVAFFVFAFVAFFWLLYPAGQALKISSPHNLGDLALHLTLIRQIAFGGEFWPDNPLLSGSSLGYPVGMNLLNAAGESNGWPTIPLLIGLGFAGAMATLGALRAWGGWFVVFGFLFNGGLAGTAFFFDWQLRDFQADLAWKSIGPTMLVTQRGFLFAFPAGCLLLADLHKRLRRSGGILPLWLTLSLFAAMPLFHMHTALFLGGLLVWWVVFGGFTARKIGAILLGVALVAWPGLLWFVTGRFEKREGLLWKPGWMAEDQGIWFWIENFGVLIPVLLVYVTGTILRLLRGRANVEEREAILFVVPALIWFGICCLISLHPWAWDNTKIMVWSYLALLPAIGSWLAVRCRPMEQMVVTVLLFFSGALSMLGAHTQGRVAWELAVRPELVAIQRILDKVDPQSRIATAPRFDHPVLLLGRKVALGYPAHVWSHGLSYSWQLEDLNRLMKGEEGWEESAQRLEVSFLFWGLREAEEFPDSMRPWLLFPLATSQWGNLYDLRPFLALDGNRRNPPAESDP
ncbi:MAG: hypothetical protein SNJ52_04655 [Verrucomicrobiia bacterium]